MNTKSNQKPRVVNKLFGHILRFVKLEAAGGLILLACAALAMVLANSDLRDPYFSVLSSQWGLDLFGHPFRLSLQTWINDALMAIFFFVVGMEIKHELTHGALASLDRASLPVLAAIGGMVAPALVFLAIGPSGADAHGWGIPMATDIAFAVGVMALLGKRVPTELKIFLLALAIADDLGAVLVIALFYTSGVKLMWLALAAGCSALIWFLARKNMRNALLHLFLGVFVWFATHESGIHATIAGVVLGFLMPHEDPNPDDPTPLERWVVHLHPYVSFAIMPIFALANAGVTLQGLTFDVLFKDPLVSGVSYGLLIGKPLGIFLISFIGIRLGLARLPQGVTKLQLLGAGALGGIGFTMSLFIAQLALQSPESLNAAKIGVVKGSLTSALLGCVILIFAAKRTVRGADYKE